MQDLNNHRRHAPWMSIWVILAANFVVGLTNGCASPPHAASTNRQLEGDEGAPDRILDSSEQRQIREAFNQVADDHIAVHPPTPAAHGMRWSDLDAAVADACDETEMAVVRSTEQPWGMEYTLLTIEDLPGTLIVRDTNDERIYEAEATIGHFGDRTDRASALLARLNEKMLAYGRKRAIEKRQ